MKKKELRKIKSTSTSEIKEDYQNLDVSIILVEPQGPVNIGMISRSMKNFGFKNLILFNPQCEIGSEARKFSMHALDILKNARIIKTSENEKKKALENLFNEYNYVIGTSAKNIRFNNMKRITYYVDELDLSSLQIEKTKITFVFGREDTGLFNEELDLCDFVIKIPVDDNYPALNLSHAVSIVLFSIYKKLHTIGKGDVMPSSQSDREQLYKIMNEVLREFDYTQEASNKVIRAMKNILGRSFSSLKEINLLISLFSSIIKNKKKDF